MGAPSQPVHCQMFTTVGRVVTSAAAMTMMACCGAEASSTTSPMVCSWGDERRGNAQERTVMCQDFTVNGKLAP